MIMADIRFNDGSVKRCRGRIVNGESVPWTDEADVRAHIAYLHGKGFTNMAVVRRW
jgi:hypothetical protein